MNKSALYFLAATVVLLWSAGTLQAQRSYTAYSELTRKVQSLASANPAICSVRSLVRTTGGKDIWMVTIGTGKKDEKPAIAVIGGVDGRYILSRELAYGFASSLLGESSDEDVKKLLEKVTFYVFPDVSPDASAQYFAALKYERSCNARPTDDDRDFTTDEDGFEDLNGDGLITNLRISDPSGKYIKDPDDDRLMREADLSKGQTGKYLLYSEGIDNDKDGLFNEDGDGGVSFNRNFSFNYEFFGTSAGQYQVSEPETKAVADFLFDRFNIFAVFTFGPQDNLGQPAKSAPPEDKSQVIKSVTKEDEIINKVVSDRYHEITGVTGMPPESMGRGDFMEWAYFHYGRYSFGTPAWWFPADKDKNLQAEFLKYIKNTRQDDLFVQWKQVDHPDFPGKKAEIGGIKPFAMYNPPADSADKLIAANYRFIKALAGMHPELEFLDIKTENAGEGIYRISLKLHNAGIFATLPKVAEDNLYTRILKVSLEASKGQAIISGQKVKQIKRLDGGDSVELSWLISGKGAVRISAGAVNTGTVTATIGLK